MEYTKGEWEGYKAKDGQCYVRADSHMIAHCFQGIGDAHLMATAPEILEVCKEWLDLWLYIRDRYPDIELPPSIKSGADACGRLRQVIAKAESK
ncbi:hypothetical protein LCGC14_0420590 [marine sediment metagenome]|uniref:Uncharacterized protein n=1 Tax=marine sediment metagenome TaxID=412755 RepID=A0A0F9SR28_9ZZZZ